MTALKRNGRRAARRHARQDGAGMGVTEAIWPGIEAGKFAALSARELSMIDTTAMRILGEIGLKGATRDCIDTVCAAGGSLTTDRRLLFPEPMVRRVLKTAGRGFHLFGQRPEHDLDPSGARTHFGTSGAAVHIIDSETGQIRDTTLRDLYDMARLAEALRARPPLCISTCFVVPPLTFAEEALEVIATAARHGIPLKLVSAGQAGATSPAPLAGAVAQQTAEVLAGLVYVNLLNPGHPATFGALPFVSDLRTGAMSGGSAEQGLLMAACAQMARFYDIPCAVSAGMTDSKMPDFQAGYEKGCTELLSALSGANLIYEAAGMYGSLLGCSLESFVLDNDMIGSVMRATRGFEVSEDTLSLETIRDVCVGGPGHFLAHDQTLNRMESDYYYPAMADRRTPQEWAAATDRDLLERARQRTRELLAAPDPGHIPDRLDAEIRARFPIRRLEHAKG